MSLNIPPHGLRVCTRGSTANSWWLWCSSSFRSGEGVREKDGERKGERKKRDGEERRERPLIDHLMFGQTLNYTVMFLCGHHFVEMEVMTN